MANGKRVLAASAETLTPVILELGGKDPMIVCDDADIEQAVHNALVGTLTSAGQLCMAAERIYVFASVYEPFLAKISGIVGQLRQGAPLGERKVDVGAMTMPGQVDIVERLVQDAFIKGARAVVGGKRGGPGGNFFEPTILVDVDHTMAIMREETFGPVITIMKVADEAEAIRLANDSAYGLSSSVFTRDRVRGERIARQIVAGSTVVNDFAMHYMAQDLPFGGVRGSGFGRLNGPEGLRAMCNTKAVVSDLLPLHSALKMYPVAPAAYDTARGVFKILVQPRPSSAAPAASSTSAAPCSAAKQAARLTALWPSEPHVLRATRKSARAAPGTAPARATCPRGQPSPRRRPVPQDIPRSRALLALLLAAAGYAALRLAMNREFAGAPWDELLDFTAAKPFGLRVLVPLLVWPLHTLLRVPTAWVFALVETLATAGPRPRARRRPAPAPPAALARRARGRLPRAPADPLPAAAPLADLLPVRHPRDGLHRRRRRPAARAPLARRRRARVLRRPQPRERRSSCPLAALALHLPVPRRPACAPCSRASSCCSPASPPPAWPSASPCATTRAPRCSCSSTRPRACY
jgi:hypothetical protein